MVTSSHKTLNLTYQFIPLILYYYGNVFHRNTKTILLEMKKNTSDHIHVINLQQ